MKLLLVGTNHKYQSDSQNGDSGKFVLFLRQICSNNAIDLLAEEMSVGAIKIIQAKSTALELAKNLGINHKFCDPDKAERIVLGIPSAEQLKALLGLDKNLFNAQLDLFERAERDYWPIREAEWLCRIEKTLCHNCLFILGANHVYSFSALAINRGLRVQIVCDRWSPYMM